MLSACDASQSGGRPNNAGLAVRSETCPPVSMNASGSTLSAGLRIAFCRAPASERYTLIARLSSELARAVTWFALARGALLITHRYCLSDEEIIERFFRPHLGGASAQQPPNFGTCTMLMTTR